MIKSFKDLRIYKRGYELNLKIHNISMKLPDYERYVICDQIRRAALSIPLNIAEGYGKKESDAEFKRYLRIALGSCNEVEVLLDIIYDLKYIDGENHEEIVNGYIELGKQIYSTIIKWSRIEKF